MPVLENIEDFQKFDQPSRRFMQFEERLLTGDRGDKSHWSTVSFFNCMLRVPGSLNYDLVRFNEKGQIIDIPYDARVRAVKHWDGNIPDVKKVLLMLYYNYLQFTAIRDIHKHKQKDRRVYGRARSCSNIHGYGYDYIERLINKPINKHRNYCVWRILVPYYINVKGLSRSQTFDLVKTWLDKCDSVSRLDFVPKQKLDYELDHVGKFTPIRQHQLKEGHPKLYALLEKEGIT